MSSQSEGQAVLAHFTQPPLPTRLQTTTAQTIGFAYVIQMVSSWWFLVGLTNGKIQGCAVLICSGSERAYCVRLPKINTAFVCVCVFLQVREMLNMRGPGGWLDTLRFLLIINYPFTHTHTHTL